MKTWKDLLRLTSKLTRSVLWLALWSFPAFAASNQSLVYQGRLVRPDGSVPNSGTIVFTLSVYSPQPAHCLLYSETQVVSMAGANGMFSLNLGSGTRVDGGSQPFSKIFVNGSTFTGLTCASGTSYTAGATDDRDLVVSFNDAGTVVNLSSMAIKSIPFALQAHEIDGWGLSNLVKVSSLGSATTFTTTEMANVKSVGAAACATNEILKWNGSAWMCSADATGGAPGDAGYTGSKGLVAFDTDAATSGITVSSGIAKLSNTGVTAATYGTASKVPAIAVNAQGRITTATEIPISIPSTQITVSGASSGDVLKWNGSAWLPAADNTGTSPGDATYAAKGIVQFNTDAATSGISLSSGVATVNFGTGANQIVKLDGSSKLPAVDGSQLTNLSAAQITAGTLPISRGGTGQATKTAAFDALSPNSTKGDITVFNGTNNISLPIGSNGQVLTADSAQATGVKWASPTTGTVTSVTGGTGLTGGTITSVGTLAVDVGTGANQIVQLDGSSKLPAVNGSQLTNLSAAQITAGTLPVNRGGTGASTFNANQLVGTDATGTVLQSVTCSANQVLSFDASGNYGCYNLSSLAGGTYFANGGNTFGANATLGTNDNFTLGFKTNGTVAMTVDASGNVGIGTASPVRKLSVAGDGIKIVNGSGNAVLEMQANAGSLYRWMVTNSNYQLYDATNGSSRLTILNSGEVGIGTTSPGAALDVKGAIRLSGATSGYAGFQPATNAGSTVWTLPIVDGSTGQFLMTDGAGNLSWGTSAAPGDATYAAKGIVQFNTDAATSGISVSSGVATVNFGTGANQIVKLDGSSKLPAVDGSQLTNLSAAQISAGTLPISRGGTGQVTKTSAFDALSPNSTKGDITVFNGTNNVSLPVGSNGQVLTADSAQANGVKWASPTTGTVTSVTGGTGLTGGTITSVGTLAVDVGTGANQIVQLDGSSKLPAVDGSQLTNLSAAQISAGTLPVNHGGTGAVSFSANQLVGSNGAGTALQSVTCGQNKVLSFDASGNYGCYDLTSLASGTYFANGGNTFGANATLGTNDNYTLSLRTNSTNRMTIDATGNVGIGTSSPSFPLSIDKNYTGTGSTNGLYSFLYTSGTNNSGNLMSVKGSFAHTSSGTLTSGYAGRFGADSVSSGVVTKLVGVEGYGGSQSGSSAVITNAYGGYFSGQGYMGTVTNAYGVYSEVYKESANTTTKAYGVYSTVNNVSSTASGVITDSYGGYFQVKNVSGSAVNTNAYGVYVGNVEGTTTKFSLYASDSTAPSYFAGNVGIGTTGPNDKLEVNGTIRTTASVNNNSSTSIDWSKGNTQYTAAGCTGTQYTFSNMRDGGVYTLVITGTFSANCTFGQTSPDTLSGTPGTGNFYFLPANAIPTGSNSIYSFMRVGNNVYVTWNSGFQN